LCVSVAIDEPLPFSDESLQAGYRLELKSIGKKGNFTLVLSRKKSA
jgi:hypothetical protein